LIIVEKSKENHYVCQEKSFYQPFFTGLPPARFTGGHWIRFTSDNQVFLMARKTGNTGGSGNCGSENVGRSRHGCDRINGRILKRPLI
jgi:hypothetical protein